MDYFKNKAEQYISQEFGMKRNGPNKRSFCWGNRPSGLRRKNHRKVCTTLYYFILTSTVTGCISVSDFASLIGILIGITSSAIWLKFFATTAKYKAIIKKKKKRHDEIVLSEKKQKQTVKILIPMN